MTRAVATPEGIEFTLRSAGPVSRALAWLIDLLLRAGVALPQGNCYRAVWLPHLKCYSRWVMPR